MSPAMVTKSYRGKSTISDAVFGGVTNEAALIRAALVVIPAINRSDAARCILRVKSFS